MAVLDRSAAVRRLSGAGRANVLPGLAVVAVATAVAFGAARLVPGLNASTVGVALGALVANTGLHRPVLRPGTHLAGHRLLRVAVVLLGLQLSLTTVAVTFTGTRLLGRWLGVPPARSLLIATGFSICGASAVAAMEPVAAGDEQDTGTAVALVTLCGTLAILVLPLLRAPLGLDVAAFGSWVGASVHDVGQTVATANRVPGALTTAVVVKLTRVVLLAPLVTAVAIGQRRQLRRRRARHLAPAAEAPHRAPPVPLFVAGFLAAVLLTSTGVLPAAALSGAKTLQGVLLTAALVGLGTGIHLPTLRRTGGRALLLGLASWVLVGGVAYLGVRVLGQ